MPAETALRPAVVGVVLAMAAGTYATKAGGLWILGRVAVPPRVEAALDALPGAVVVAILGPELARAGPAEWAAGAVVLLVSRRAGSVPLALLAGVAAVLLFRGPA